MATPEAKIKKKIKTILDTTHAYWIMPVTSGFGKAGVADFTVCIRGKYVAIEAKAGKGKLTALQAREAGGVQAAGGTALIINETNIDTLKEVLDGL